MTLRERLRAKRDRILAEAMACGAYDVRVFGSVARGDYDERSDIDLLVRLAPGRSLLDLVRLEDRLSSMMGRPVDVVTEASLRGSVRSAALSEAVSV